MIISQIQPLTHLSSQSASFADTQFSPSPPTGSSQPVPSSPSAARTSASCSGFPVPRVAACTARPRRCREPGALPPLLPFHARGFSEPWPSWVVGRDAWLRVKSSPHPARCKVQQGASKACQVMAMGFFFFFFPPSGSPRPVGAAPGIGASLNLSETHFG